jgi:hypothetical protein
MPTSLGLPPFEIRFHTRSLSRVELRTAEEQEQLYPRAHIELVKYRSNVMPDRRFSNSDLVGNLFVLETAADQSGNFSFAVRQGIQSGVPVGCPAYFVTALKFLLSILKVLNGRNYDVGNGTQTSNQLKMDRW